MPTVATAQLFSLFSATTHAWGNEDRKTRNKIKLTNPAGEVVDAPVLIRLHTGNFDFLSANENGSDQRVVAGDDATGLKFERGQIFLDPYPVSLEELRSQLSALKAANPVPMVVKGDTVVAYGRVMEVLELLGQFDITRFGPVTQRRVK